MKKPKHDQSIPSPQLTGHVVGITTTPGRRPTIGDSLSAEVAAAAAGIVDRLLRQLTGRAYSPRIKLLDIDQVLDATGLGKTTIYELINNGKFPRPQRGLGKNMWRESALIAWADANDPNLAD